MTCIYAANVQAWEVPLAFGPGDFDDLGTWRPVVGWPVETTTMTASYLNAEVTHQAFQESDTGVYACLCQKNFSTWRHLCAG